MTTHARSDQTRDAVLWLSTKQAAGLLGVRVRELYRLIDKGDLPAYKMGRLIRLRRRDVLATWPASTTIRMKGNLTSEAPSDAAIVGRPHEL